MKRLTIILGILMLMSTMIGCSGKSVTAQKESVIDNSIKQKTNGDDNGDLERPSDYTIIVSGKKLSLFAWDDEIDLDSIFGESQFQETEELVNADTFSGSFLRTIKYDNTEVKLFSPKENGKRFYIFDIKSTREDFTTDRGIKVDDSLDEVRQAYPEVKRSLDGTTGSDGRYEVILNYDTYIYLLIHDGIVTEIRLCHEFA